MLTKTKIETLHFLYWLQIPPTPKANSVVLSFKIFSPTLFSFENNNREESQDGDYVATFGGIWVEGEKGTRDLEEGLEGLKPTSSFPEVNVREGNARLL